MCNRTKRITRLLFSLGALLFIVRPLAAEPLTRTATASISVSSGSLTASEPTVTVSVSAVLSGTALGAATIEIAYDPAIVSLQECVIDPQDVFDGGQCNANFDVDGTNPDRLRFNHVSIAGVTGEITLAQLSFSAVANAVGSSIIAVQVLTFASPTGETVSVTTTDGTIAIRQSLAESPVSSTALPDWSPAHLVDGNPASQWSSNGHGEHLASSEWAAVLLKQRANIQQIRLYPRYNTTQQADGFPKDFVLLYSRNGYRGQRELTCNPADPRFVDAGNWIPISNFSGFAQPNGGWISFNVNASDADCVRVLATQLTQDGYGNRYFQLAEFERIFAVFHSCKQTLFTLLQHRR